MMEFRLEEPGVRVKSVGVATAAEPQVIPLEGWLTRDAQQFRRTKRLAFACL
jgi:hypothetical protein